MYKYTSNFVVLFVLLSAIAVSKAKADDMKSIKLNDDLSITEIEDGVFVVNHSFPWSANSAVVKITQADFLMVDTPYHNEATEVLVTWLRRKFGHIRLRVINTHFHMDNLGGNGYLLSQKIPVFGSDLTVELLEKKGPAAIERTLNYINDPKYKRYYDVYKKMVLKPPDNIFKLKKGLILNIEDETIEIYHPGPAHTEDNVVVYFKNRKILFAGCMIRSLASNRIGKQSEANFEKWPQSAKNLLEKYPKAKTVIPGHGKWGGIDLIHHTIKLIKQRQ